MSDLFYLPPGTIPPMVMPFDPTATLPLALVTVSSPTVNETKLYDIAYFDLRNRLQGISGVIAPAIYGGKLRRVLAYVDPDKLEARDLSPMDVVRTLRNFSTLIPTGDAKFGDLDYQIITNGMPERVTEMNDFPIKIAQTGAPVLIKDVGRVEDTHAIQTNVVRISAPPDFQAKRQVYAPIYRQPGANTVAVVDALRTAIPDMLKRLPQGINLHVVMDQSFYVRRAIRNLADEGVVGGVLAALVILLFLAQWRSTLVVSLTIPLSILAAFIGLYFTSQSLNVMTLGGLALAVGRLIDDAVVVLENTDRYIRKGPPPAEAAVEAAGEVSMAALVAPIATMLVFFPVVFLTGIGRFLFTPLAIAVAFAIGASYFIAMTVVPLFCAHFLRPHDATHKEHRATLLHRFTAEFERRFERLRDRFEVGLSGSLEHKSTVLAAAAVAFLGAIFLSRFVGRELFPAVDAGQLTIQLRARSGTRIERSEEIVARVESVIRQTVPRHDLAMIISNIGVLLDWPAAYTPNAGPQDAFIDVQFTESRNRSSQQYATTIRRVLNQKFPQIDFSFQSGGMMSAALNQGLPSPIDIQVVGNSLETASQIAEQVKKVVGDVPGAVDVRIKQKLDYPAIRVDVDRIRAAYLGLTPLEVVQNVVTSLNSSVNFDPAFWIDQKNGNHYFLGAQYPEENIVSVDTLKSIPVTRHDGSTPTLSPFPVRNEAQQATVDDRLEPLSSSRGNERFSLLRNLATPSYATAPTEVEHLNINRVIDVYVNVAGHDVGGVASDIERRLDALGPKLPAGYTVAVRGEVQSMRE